MLELLYHNRNPLITTVVHGSIKKNNLRLSLERKTLEEDIIFAWYYNNEIIINNKTLFLHEGKYFS